MGVEMLLVRFFIYVVLISVIVFDVCWVFKCFEYMYCTHIRIQPPLVSSNKYERYLAVEQIKTKYPNAKNICEIGSGFGGLARKIARANRGANVYALENMPFSAFVSKVMDRLTYCKNNKTIWGDAFEYLDNTDVKFDIAVAYLGSDVTQKIKKYKNKIRVFISLDFELNGIKPNRVIDVNGGCTLYKGVKYPHRLYVYEFQ